MKEGKEVSKDEFFKVPDQHNPAEHIVRISKRVSPSDYWDGYLAGLRAAAEAIDHFIETAEETRRMANAALKSNDQP